MLSESIQRSKAFWKITARAIDEAKKAIISVPTPNTSEHLNRTFLV
jgi:hypothetical protein